MIINFNPTFSLVVIKLLILSNSSASRHFLLKFVQD